MAGAVIDFDIDVSGEDILNLHYTICVAGISGRIKGFKMTPGIVSAISSRYGQGQYRYEKSKSGKSRLKVRFYCIILYYLFNTFKVSRARLHICRDFDGREDDIRNNLDFFLGHLLDISVEGYDFGRLGRDSLAHRYAYLMRKDTSNRLDTYISLKLEDIEKYLR